MADEEAPVPGSFAFVLATLLAGGAGGITSQRSLGARLAEIRGTDPESERKNVRRHLKEGIEPEEETIADYATAFGIARDTFPPARRGGKTARAARQASTIEERLAAMIVDLRRLERQLRRSGEDSPEVHGRVRSILEELEGLAGTAQGLRETLDTAQGSPRAPSAVSAGERGGRRS